MTSLSEQLMERLGEFADRHVLGIYVDTVLAFRLEAERDENGRLYLTEGGRGADGWFAGFPVKASPRPGLWIILEGPDGRNEEIHVAGATAGIS